MSKRKGGRTSCRYRQGKVVRRHRVIQGIEDLLDRLGRQPGVQTIATGPICSGKGDPSAGKVQWVCKAMESSSVLLTFKCGGRRQDVRIVGQFRWEELRNVLLAQ